MFDTQLLINSYIEVALFMSTILALIAKSGTYDRHQSLVIRLLMMLMWSYTLLPISQFLHIVSAIVFDNFVHD